MQAEPFLCQENSLLNNQITHLLEQALAAVQNAENTEELHAVEVACLGRNKGLNELRREVGALPKEERPAFGQNINEAVQILTAALKAKQTELAQKELNAALTREQIDVTLPGIPMPAGRLHPLTATACQIKQILGGMGYEFVDGPELEEYRYNFEALNYPPDHPAMDEQNSFFVTDTRLLRTQTTALQGRIMEQRKPPFRIATTGRCFRYEAVDATHHHTFHQIDVFMVEENISMAHLKGTLGVFARELFGQDTRVRFRPDFFPFVEPGVDYSISWTMPDGRVRWLEIGGAGLIHPNILRSYGISTERYSGFAFGLGVERIHMLRTGVSDLRLYLDNHPRFLEQFA